MDDEVDIVGGVDEPADAAGAEHEHPENLRRYRGVPPGQLTEPSHQPGAPAGTRAALERGHHVEEGEETGKEDRKREKGLKELPPLMDTRIGNLMVQSEGGGEEQEEQEGGARHRIAE